jgi:hypothetical protein
MSGRESASSTSVYEGYQNSPRNQFHGGGRHGCPEKLWAPLLVPPSAFLNASRKKPSGASVIRWQRPLLPFREVMKYLAGFKDTGKRMLAAWSEEVSFLRDSRTYSLSPWKSAAAFEGIFDPPKLKKRKPSSVARSYWLTVPNPNLSDRCNSQTSWQYRSTSATRTGNLRAGRRTYPLGRIVRVDSLRAWRSDHFYLTFSIAKLCCTVPRERFSTMALQSFFSTAAISVLLSSTRSA